MILEACIPMPIQMVIDDVGWRNGQDGSLANQPYRTGIGRLHVPDDYQAIISLGKRLNIRPQAAMILGEWDVDNLIRQIPTASWMGECWDNHANLGGWMQQASEIIHNNPDHIELTLHGIMHEYWCDGRMSRAEWADENGNMRCDAEVRARLDLFAQLMQRHGLGDMPTSFVPCAFMHGFGHETHNIAAILASYGVRSMSTPFEVMAKHKTPEHQLIGFDHGVMVIDRGRCWMPWYALGSECKPTLSRRGPVVGLHWPNLLHRDPRDHDAVTDQWVQTLLPLDDSYDSMLAANTDNFCRQLLHYCFSNVTLGHDAIEINLRQAFAQPWAGKPDGELTLKCRHQDGRVTRHMVAIDVDQPDVRIECASLPGN